MDDKRFSLFLLLSLLAVLVYTTLVKPPPPPEPSPAPSHVTRTSVTGGELTAAPTGELAQTASPEREEFAELPPVVVDTGVYHVEFTNRGARPMRWRITDPLYSHVGGAAAQSSAEGIDPLEMITQVPAEVGLDSGELPLEIELPGWPSTEDFNRVNWQLVEPPTPDPRTGTIQLAFESPERGGLVVRKEFTFHRPRPDGAMDDDAGGYLSDLRLVIRNVGQQRVTVDDATIGMALTWGPGIGAYEPVGYYNMRTPLALVDDDTWYQQPRAGEAREVATGNPEGIEWAGLQSRYFMAAIIPAGDHRPVVSKVQAAWRPENVPAGEQWKHHSPLLTASLEHGSINLAPGGEQVTTYQLYVGPKHRPHLLAAGHGLSRAEHYNSWFWMRGLMVGLSHILGFFHGLLGSYGMAILLLTVVVRLVMYPLTRHQMKVMAHTQREMARIKPHLDEVREKYKGDPAKMQRETMAVYREHGVNPFAGLKGCLPLLLQAPIFFALFRMLGSSVELRGASFLWISDLSSPDALFHTPWLEQVPLIGGFLGPTFNLLPVLMALSQWMSMRLSSVQATDPNQRFMMNFMPIMLTMMLFKAPSGLMIYWVASNLWQMGQQYLISRHVRQHEEEAEAANPAGAAKPSSSGSPPARRSAKSLLDERRKEAAQARRRAMAESPSLPRWARRGSR